MHCLWKTCIFLMHKCIKCQHNYFTKDSCMHELRDVINLEWFSQVLSSLFRTNLRELALILSKNSDSIIESNLSKRDRKQDPSLWVGMMTTDAPSLVYFFEMLYCRRTIMLDPHHGRDPACPQSSLLSRLIFSHDLKTAPWLRKHTTASSFKLLFLKLQPISFYIPSFA